MVGGRPGRRAPQLGIDPGGAAPSLDGCSSTAYQSVCLCAYSVAPAQCAAQAPGLHPEGSVILFRGAGLGLPVPFAPLPSTGTRSGLPS